MALSTTIRAHTSPTKAKPPKQAPTSTSKRRWTKIASFTGNYGSGRCPAPADPLGVWGGIGSGPAPTAPGRGVQPGRPRHGGKLVSPRASTVTRSWIWRARISARRDWAVSLTSASRSWVVRSSNVDGAREARASAATRPARTTLADPEKGGSLPAAIGASPSHRGHARPLHPPLLGQPADVPDVALGPAAAVASRGEPLSIAELIPALNLTVDPALAESLIERLRVAEGGRCGVPLLGQHQPNASRIGMV